MAAKDTKEAVDQLNRALRGVERAYDLLEDIYHQVAPAKRRRIFKKQSELNLRKKGLTSAIQDLEAAGLEVTVPSNESYQALDAALADLQKLEVETDGIKHAIEVAVAIGDAAKSTRKEVAGRTEHS